VRLAQLDLIFRRAVEAVDATALVARALADLALDPGDRPVTVLALGKAARGMVWGAHRVFGDDLTGVAVLHAPGSLPEGVRGVVGGHPIPDERSVRAGESLLAAAAAVPSGSLVLCLVSGGGSALAEVPAPGLAIADVATVNRLLLGSGAAIGDVNVVRRAMSQIKGGGLGARMATARLVTLAISDVGSAPPATIASGPTIPSESAGLSPREVLDGYGLLDLVPAGVAGQELATGAISPPNHVFKVIADGSTAANGAAAAATSMGLAASVVERELAGEARDEAPRVLADARHQRADVAIHIGETTVTVTGAGRGGRNHEAALSAALALEGSEGAFLAGGTDGVDGLAGGAGAVVDGMTVGIGLRLGRDPELHLEANDSGGFFDVVPGRIVTGPTGTNVADLWLTTRRGRAGP
jgi:hydroxypyruvate reductase